jgi:hypothetical protein
MTSERISPLVMAKPRDGLMSAAPAGPGKAVGKRERSFADEAEEKPSDFGCAQGHHHREIRTHLEGIGIECF